MASLLHFSNIPSKGGDSNANEKEGRQEAGQEDRQEEEKVTRD
jgi:hypothetical protein